jgi:hypothetical protein
MKPIKVAIAGIEKVLGGLTLADNLAIVLKSQ